MRVNRIHHSDKILLAIAILLATIQFVLSQTSTLSTWKGGGFGMYATPHPNSNRTSWIRGESGTKDLAIRIYPADPRLPDLVADATAGELAELFYDEWYGIYFPTLYNWDRLERKYRKILAENENSTEPHHLPITNLTFEVLESSISENGEAIQRKHIYRSSDH